MRNKKLWKNLMLVTTLTVALGTVSATALAEDDVTLAGGTQVTAFASEGDIDGGIAVEAQAEQTAPGADTTDAEATTPEATVPEADTTGAEAIVPEEVAPEATAPEADTTVKDEVSTKATAPTINATASSTTFDGTQDIVVTYKVNGEAGTFHVYTDIPQLEGLGVACAIKEKVSDSEYKITIPAQKLKMLIDAGSIKEGQVVTLSSGYTAEGEGYDPVAFPTVSFTYTTGDNGDNGNGDNGNGETPEKPENPDPEKPENPDNGGDNGDNQNPDGDNNQTPETQTPQTQTVSTTQTAPKTGDAASTLPLLGTGLTSLGVALGAIFKKRR